MLMPPLVVARVALELGLDLGLGRALMCWMCEHPGAAPDEYRDHLRNLISNYGWAIQGVESDGRNPAWSYTVGLTAQGHPELVMTGLDGPGAAGELDDAAGLLARAGLPAPGDPFILPSGRVAELVVLANPWAHLNLAVALYGKQGFKALQLVYRDARRRWPWDEGYSGPHQPVLGIRAVSL